MSNHSLLPTSEAIKAVLKKEVLELPTLPVVALKLLKLTRDDHSSAADLVKVVETDPALTTKVLKIINSAAYGFKQKISSVNQAVVLLGFDVIRTLALEVTLFEQLVKPERGLKFDRVFFWQHCLSVAGLSMAIAEATEHTNPEEAYVAGLLHDIGKIILDVYGCISYRDFLRNLSLTDGLMVDEERKLIGMSHDDVGAFFCNLWGIPENVVLALRLHHQRFGHLRLSNEQSSLVATVALANFITWTQGIGSVDTVRQPILQPEVEEIIDVDRLDLEALITRMDQEVKSTADFYQFSFPSSEKFRQNLLRANLRLSRVNTRFFYLRANADKVDLAQIATSLTQPHRSLDPEEIVSSTLEAIQGDFGFDRIYLLRIDQASRSLTIAKALDTVKSGTPFLGLQIPITPLSGKILASLRSNTPVVLTGISSSGEQEALELLEAAEIGMVPFSDNNHIIGLLGVDNCQSQRPIKAESLYAVAIVANELGMALENARHFEEVKNRATLDPLTKVNNRATLDDLLEESFQLAKAGELKLSLAMIDIDHFKHFNDSFGHLAGDSILELLGGSIKKLSRPTDDVARYGGEEFVVVLNQTDLTEAVRFGERLRREIENLGKLLLKRFPGTPLTVSIGVSSYAPAMKAKQDLIAKADQALYAAKKAGRNRVMSLP